MARKRPPRGDKPSTERALRPSKSAQKRDSTARQALGVTLADQPAEVLDELDLPAPLRKAVEELRPMTKNGAIRRQRQYIGRLMRDIDPEPIRALLASRQQDDVTAKRHFKTAETWRDRILREGPAGIEACAEALPVAADELTGLHDRARNGVSEIDRKTASRQLFRYLHKAATGAGKISR